MRRRRRRRKQALAAAFAHSRRRRPTLPLRSSPSSFPTSTTTDNDAPCSNRDERSLFRIRRQCQRQMQGRVGGGRVNEVRISRNVLLETKSC